MNEPQQKYIDAMVENYINTIQPLVTQIRETSYVFSAVEKDTDLSNKLIELPYTLGQLIQPESKDDISKIIRNNK